MQKIVVVLLLCVVAVSPKKNLPKYIKPCPRNSDIPKCIQENLEVMRPHLENGVPRLSIPPLDPLPIPSASLILSNLTFSLVGLTFHGVSKVQLQDLQIDLEEASFNTKMVFPHMTATARYVMEGSLYGAEVNGDSTGNAEVYNSTYAIKLKGTKKLVDDKTYIVFKKVSFEVLSLSGGSVYFKDLVPNNEELSKAVNALVNRNLLDFAVMVGPILDNIFGDIFLGIVRNNFLKFPLEQLFPLE